MMRKSHDRRRAPRTPVLMSVRYEGEVLSGGAEAVDVSPAGLFLGTREPLPVGTVLRLRIGEAPLRVRVVRVVEGEGSGRTRGMGVAILEIGPEARKALEQHLGKARPERVPVVVEKGSRWPEPVTHGAEPDPPANGAARKSRSAASGRAAKSDGGTSRKRGRKRREPPQAEPKT
jgi:hypothetical protein